MPPAMETTPARSWTWTGSSRSVVVLSPSWPKRLLPHAQAVPSPAAEAVAGKQAAAAKTIAALRAARRRFVDILPLPSSWVTGFCPCPRGGYPFLPRDCTQPDCGIQWSQAIEEGPAVAVHPTGERLVATLRRPPSGARLAGSQSGVAPPHCKVIGALLFAEAHGTIRVACRTAANSCSHPPGGLEPPGGISFGRGTGGSCGATHGAAKSWRR